MTLSSRKGAALDKGKILNLLSNQGAVARRLKNFEVRNEQQALLEQVVEAFNQNAIALIEAGTGTGKSIAYLIPTLFAAAYGGERVVVSTHTIALQEQLIEKDLPLLMEALDIPIKAVLVKGMGNYVCLRKLEELEHEKGLLDPEERDIVSHVENLSWQRGIGSRSEFPLRIPPQLWESLNADYETCNGPDCPHYQKCYYVQARKNALDAQLLVVNHHILLADLVAKADAAKFSRNLLLPHYNRLVIDEAHHIEDVATDYFANRISRLELLKLLSKVSHEKLGRDQGKLPLIKEKLLKHQEKDFSKESLDLYNRLTLDIPALRRDLLKEIADSFQALDHYQKETLAVKSLEENKLRLCKEHYESPIWKEIVVKRLEVLKGLLKRFSQELTQVEAAIRSLEDDRLLDAVKGPLHDLKNLAGRIGLEAEGVEKFAVIPSSTDSIRWLESTLTKSGHNMACVEAALNISDLLLKYLFQPVDTVALLSATLTTKGSFYYVKEQMGLHQLKERPLIEAVYQSPFNFEKQALLIVPKDIPQPNSPKFLDHAERLIMDAIEASSGNAFILFTSYGMLQTCFSRLEEKLVVNRYFPLKQGSESRSALLARFVNQERSVLFGTDSFWEGVDVAGEALRLVIIAKLPFKVPSDPLIQAKSEALESKKRDPFRELLLPQAAIKLKQGFGRLIRNRKDRGCIVCLDNRLVMKSYGNYLLKSLPSCPLLTIDSSQVKEKMSEFYKKTYYLTK